MKIDVTNWSNGVNIINYLRLSLLINALLLITITFRPFFGYFVHPTYVEQVRTISPSRRVDAVWVLKEFGPLGATVDNSFELFIVPRDGMEFSNAILRADKVDGFSMQWLDENTLEVSIGQGRIFHFQNSWRSREVDNFSFLVEIILKNKLKRTLPR